MRVARPRLLEDGRDGKKWLHLRAVIKVKHQVLLWDWQWSVRQREESGLF